MPKQARKTMAETTAPVIDVAKVKNYHQAVSQLTALKKAAAALEKEVDALEVELIGVVKPMGSLQVSNFVIKVNQVTPTCRPKWKEEFEGLVVEMGRIPEVEVEKVVEKVKATLKPQDRLLVIDMSQA